jgi:cell division protein FtsB
VRPGGTSTSSKTTKQATTKKRAKRRASRSALVRRWLAVGALVLVGLLYYRPLIAYRDAHGELAQKRAAVAKLQQEKSRLQHRLGASTSIETLAREARSLGYVKPNEHLFIVKGINAWRKRERANLARP